LIIILSRSICSPIQRGTLIVIFESGPLTLWLTEIRIRSPSIFCSQKSTSVVQRACNGAFALKLRTHAQSKNGRLALGCRSRCMSTCCGIRRDTHWRPEEWTRDGSSTSWATPRSRILCATRRCRPSRSRISGGDSPVRARLLGTVTLPNGSAAWLDDALYGPSAAAVQGVFSGLSHPSRHKNKRGRQRACPGPTTCRAVAATDTLTGSLNKRRGH
jgi:hypothetical protein